MLYLFEELIYVGIDLVGVKFISHGKDCPVTCQAGTKRGKATAVPILSFGTRRGG